MANDCNFTMVVRGEREDCLEWLNRMQYSNPMGKHFYRMDADASDFGIGIDGNYFIQIDGVCAWSLESCCRSVGEGKNIDLFEDFTRELSLVMEAYSSEPGIGFQEHYVYDNGEVVAAECEDYAEAYWDVDYYKSFEEFSRYHNPAHFTEEDFDDEGYAKSGGFGEDWGNFTYYAHKDTILQQDEEPSFLDGGKSILFLISN